MALDQALLDLVTDDGDAYLRLYRWQPYCLSFGRHEPAARRYDRDRIHQLGLSVVRRPTGGRAVWHARELTYAVAAPTTAFGTLKEAYRAIHSLLAQALTSLGAATALARSGRPPPRLDAGPCFAHPAGGEVMIEGRKVVGSAQLRLGDAFLQHGSLLLEDSQDIVVRLLGQSGPSVPTVDTPLSTLLGRRIAFDEVAAAILVALEGWHGPWNPADPGLTTRLRAVADRHAGRFRDDAWTWCR
jgi:lipoate-protein ligase A